MNHNAAIAGSPPSAEFIAAAKHGNWGRGAAPCTQADSADDIIRLLRERPARGERKSLAPAYTGIYPSFQRHSEVIAQKYAHKIADILAVLSPRRLAGGQEYMSVAPAFNSLASQ